MYYLKRLQRLFSTDTFVAYMKSLHGNTCCQVYLNKTGFVSCYPQLNVKGVSLAESLDYFVNDFGAPENITVDGFSLQVGKNTRFFKNLCKYLIKHYVSAPRRLNENPV